MAEVRAAAGDRDLLGWESAETPRYQRRIGQDGLYDDVAYYEGRYPSEVAAGGGAGGEEGVSTAGRRVVNRRSFLSSNDS